MDTRRIRRLKLPAALEVVAADGVPRRILLHGRWQNVTLARSPWRIEQHWWRGDAIRRDYFRVAPEDSPVLTIYHDLGSGEWARQEYVGAGLAQTKAGLKKPGLSRSYAPDFQPPARRASPRNSRR